MNNIFKLYKSTLKKLFIPAVIMGILLIVSTVLFINGRAREVNDYGYYGYYGVGSFFRGKTDSLCHGAWIANLYDSGGRNFDLYVIQLFKQAQCQ